MKTRHTPFLIIAALLSLPGLAWAEPDTELQQKYEEKIAKSFVAHGGWIVSFDEARERAEKEKKFIFAYFTRSYAR